MNSTCTQILEQFFLNEFGLHVQNMEVNINRMISLNGKKYQSCKEQDEEFDVCEGILKVGALHSDA
jgi:hypothetical protein